MVQIQSDIVLAFILLVMFNFGMNLFLFYKWHKSIDEGEDALVEQHRRDNLTYDEFWDEVEQEKKSKPTYDEWKEKKSKRGTSLNVPNALHKAFGYKYGYKVGNIIEEEEEEKPTPTYDLGKK